MKYALVDVLGKANKDIATSIATRCTPIPWSAMVPTRMPRISPLSFRPWSSIPAGGNFPRRALMYLGPRRNLSIWTHKIRRGSLASISELTSKVIGCYPGYPSNLNDDEVVWWFDLQGVVLIHSLVLDLFAWVGVRPSYHTGFWRILIYFPWGWHWIANGQSHIPISLGLLRRGMYAGQCVRLLSMDQEFQSQGLECFTST